MQSYSPCTWRMLYSKMGQTAQEEILMNNIQVTDWYRSFIQQQVKPGDLCIDATMGNGNDTLLLCQLAGPSGHCTAFDIQETALSHTKSLLDAKGIPDSSYTLLLKSHESIRTYAQPESVSCIVFNLGYLPAGDHTLATKPASTLIGIRQGLSLLKPGGLMTVCIYSGGDSGFEERDAVLEYLKGLDPRQFLVIVSQYYNRPKNPPVPVLIIRL